MKSLRIRYSLSKNYPISVGKLDSLAALSYRPFLRLFIGASVSNIGTWVASVAVGIYLQSTTGDARYVAIGAGAAFLPHALMGLISGAVADNFSRKKILIFNNITSSSIALFLATAVGLGFASPILVITCVFLAGFLNALSFPTWQAFLADIVPKENVPGALTLMMAQWNLGRIIGPPFAAILLLNQNYTLAFGVNSAGFLLVIFMLFLIRPQDYQQHEQEEVVVEKKLKNILLGGWQYIFSPESGLRRPFIVFASFIALGSPFIALIPNIADEIFNRPNAGTALFTTSQGIGAVIVAFLLSTLQKKYGFTYVQRVALFCLPISLVLIGVAPNLAVGAFASFVFGIAYSGSITSATVSGQLSARPLLRGRIAAAFMSSIGLIFPIASFVAGIIVNAIGARTYFISSGIILMFLITIIGLFRSSYKLPGEFVSKPITEVDDIGNKI